MIRQTADIRVWRIDSAEQTSILLVTSGNIEQCHAGVFLVRRSSAAVMGEETDITTHKDVFGDGEDPALDPSHWAAG